MPRNAGGAVVHAARLSMLRHARLRCPPCGANVVLCFIAKPGYVIVSRASKCATPHGRARRPGAHTAIQKAQVKTSVDCRAAQHKPGAAASVYDNARSLQSALIAGHAARVITIFSWRHGVAAFASECQPSLARRDEGQPCASSRATVAIQATMIEPAEREERQRNVLQKVTSPGYATRTDAVPPLKIRASPGPYATPASRAWLPRPRFRVGYARRFAQRHGVRARGIRYATDPRTHHI